MAEILLIDQNDDVLTITLNRPEKLNALTPKLLEQLENALNAAAENPDISVVILKSAGPVFSAGYDLNEVDWITSQYPANFPDGVDFKQDEKDIQALLDYWLRLWRFPKPIIAQVQGPCLSGAGELLAICDIVMASDEASFSHPAARDLGIPPTVFLWPILVGMRKTSELLFTARSMDAREALQSGLINHVVPAAELDTKTREIAQNIAKTPADHLIILKQSTRNFYDNMGIRDAMAKAATLDAHFHQSPTFLSFFKTVRDKGMKAALAERKKRFG